MYTFHRLTGTLLCLMFPVWFLSAFVMMYHGFPRASAGERMEKALQPLAVERAALPAIGDVLKRLPSAQRISGMVLERSMGVTVFHAKSMGGEYTLPADSTKRLPALDAAYFNEVAALWCGAPVMCVDTLRALDRWLPYEGLKSELPIYKYRFDDKARHELYIGARGGDVLQYTDRTERLWAWLGAIPHWVYIARLRQNTAAWHKTVVWLSGVAMGVLYVRRKTGRRA